MKNYRATHPDYVAAEQEYSRIWNKSPEGKTAYKKWLYGPKGKAFKRKKSMKQRTGTTPQEKEAMFAMQGFRCKACGRTEPGNKTGWCLDHIRNTKIVRGVLCHGCNQRAGSGYDAAEDLYQARKVVEYLETFYGGNISEG